MGKIFALNRVYMLVNKGKTNSKILFFVLQLVVMSFLFVMLADKQAILLIRDFIDSLGVNSNIQSILARLYAGFKLLVNMPSFVALSICFLQVLCAATIFKKVLTVAPERTNIEAEKVDLPKYRVESCIIAKNTSYLENQRLLN